MTVFGEILVCIIFLVCFVCYIIFIQEVTDCHWWAHILWSPINILVSSMITILIIAIMAALTFTNSCDNPESKKEIEIYSIGVNSKSDVHGSFIFGCGSINGTSVPTYRFYTLNDGKYKLIEVYANNFDIVCTDTVSPKIVINATQEITYPNHTLVFKKPLHSDIDKNEWHGTIYIPEKSIIQSYNIQL